jgi:hypothetical protein
MMMMGSSITKRLDASWAVGINQGGLRGRLHRQHDLSHLADPQARHRVGHVVLYLGLFADIPTNYTQKRRIGSIIGTGGAIRSMPSLWCGGTN